jgi:hypothetical protein
VHFFRCLVKAFRPANSNRTGFVRVYVTNEASGDLSVIDAATNAIIAMSRWASAPEVFISAPTANSSLSRMSGRLSLRPALTKARFRRPIKR